MIFLTGPGVLQKENRIILLSLSYHSRVWGGGIVDYKLTVPRTSAGSRAAGPKLGKAQERRFREIAAGPGNRRKTPMKRINKNVLSSCATFFRSR